MRKNLPPILKLKAQQQRVLRKLHSARAIAAKKSTESTELSQDTVESPSAISVDAISVDAISVDAISVDAISVDTINPQISQEPTKPSNNKPTVAVCCCGFAPRSLKYTKTALQKNIIDTLQQSFNVDVYMYSFISKNNIQESSKTDEHGVAVENDDVNLLDANRTVLYQEDVAPLIKQIISANKIKLRDIAVINFIRGLLMEQKSFEVICESKKRYDSIIYVHPDMFFAKPISLKEVFDTINDKNCIYTTHFNDWNGYGTGFYIGSPKAIGCVTSQLNNLSINTSKIEAERLLKKTIDKTKLVRYKSSMFHFKVRTNGTPDVYYQLLKKYTSAKEYMTAIALFKKATKINTKTDVFSTGPELSNKMKSKDDTNVKSHTKNKQLGVMYNPKTKRHHKRRSCPN